ncbi:MAG: DUF6174 domain-containing protein [Solirubrobacterales bacterium]
MAIALPQATSAGPKFIGDTVDPGITDGTATLELSEARTLWKSTGIRRYRFSIRAACFCPYRDPVKITVRGKRIALSNRNWFGPEAVPQLFRFIREAIEGESAMLTVKYNQTRGFPKLVSIDRDRMMVDEEISYRITKFSRIKPN